jgi:hypothetical protein
MSRRNPTPELLDRLDSSLKASHEFDKEDTATLRAMIEVYRGWLSMGKLGIFFLRLGLTVSAAILGWQAFAGQVKAALKSFLS